ncbi:MAG: zinc ribbon domain-containing protein, partial [Silvibacterium sp.]
VRATKESLFTGILFDTAGMRYTPTHANKSGRRYRYYTSQSAIKKTGQCDAPARIPAPDIEKAVVDRLLEWFENPEQLLHALHDETFAMQPTEGLFDRLIARAATTAQRWRERIAEDRTEFLKNVIERVIIHSDHVEFRLRVPALVNEILGGKSPTLILTKTASIECPFRHVRAVRLVVGESSLTTDASRKAILKAIARARNWYEQLTTGEAESVAQLASMHGLSPRFINLHLKLIPLSPEWIEK